MPIEDYFLVVITGLPVVCVEYSVDTKSLIDKAAMTSMPIAASADKMRLFNSLQYSVLLRIQCQLFLYFLWCNTSPEIYLYRTSKYYLAIVGDCRSWESCDRRRVLSISCVGKSKSLIQLWISLILDTHFESTQSKSRTIL